MCTKIIFNASFGLNRFIFDNKYARKKKKKKENNNNKNKSIISE